MSQDLSLFSPLQLGELNLQNRVVLAPLTRSRAIDHVPNELMAKYYAQRASAGLLITEATMVMPNTVAFINCPGVYSQQQIAGWKKVTEAVHAKGGKIVLQLWHGGRACHPDLNQGITPVAASALAITNDQVHTPSGKQDYTVPRALEANEIKEVVSAFKQAAINAKEAGFDGVEVHAANGYLLDNFLRDGSNQRNDEYGGSIENRARLLLEVIEQVVEVWGSGRVGLRTSPLNGYNSMRDSDPEALSLYLAEQLNPKKLAYWHVMRADFLGEQEGDILTPLRKHYRGNLMANMGYQQDEAEADIAADKVDAVAFGVPFIANPDLLERFSTGAPLNQPDPDTFYTSDAKGYTDYPTLTAAS